MASTAATAITTSAANKSRVLLICDFLTDIVEQHVLSRFPLIPDLISAKVGISKRSVSQYSTGLLGIITIATLLSGVLAFVANIVGIAYPIYKSCQSILGTDVQFRKGQSFDPMADQQWLIYWIVYSFLMFVENTEPFSYLLTWIPLYSFFKIIFLTWLFIPYCKGANTIFTRVIVPALRHFQPLVRAQIESITGHNSAAAASNNGVMPTPSGPYDPKSIGTSVASAQQGTYTFQPTVGTDNTLANVRNGVTPSYIQSAPNVPTLTQVIRNNNADSNSNNNTNQPGLI